MLRASYIVTLLVTTAPASAGGDDADARFFEYLAEMEQVEGEWISPLDLPPLAQNDTDDTQESRND